jgi:Transcription elongation factor, N-terminal
MTAAGRLALQNELTNRIRVERPRLIQRIQEPIADDTNLAENSEYQAAKAEQELNEARIGELETSCAGRNNQCRQTFWRHNQIWSHGHADRRRDRRKEDMADCW